MLGPDVVLIGTKTINDFDKSESFTENSWGNGEKKQSTEGYKSAETYVEDIPLLRTLEKEKIDMDGREKQIIKLIFCSLLVLLLDQKAINNELMFKIKRDEEST